MKLTSPQKSVIKAMREGCELFQAGRKYAMDDFTFPEAKTIQVLKAKKLIKSLHAYGKIVFFTLTERGKQIDI